MWRTARAVAHRHTWHAGFLLLQPRHYSEGYSEGKQIFLASWCYFQEKLGASNCSPRAEPRVTLDLCITASMQTSLKKAEQPHFSKSDLGGKNTTLHISNPDLQKFLTSHFGLFYLKWPPAEYASTLCTYLSKVLITHSHCSCQSHLKLLSKNTS